MNEIVNPKEENIASLIYIIRGEKVMLDFDLAALYGIETKQLKRAVRRNSGRFPPDFMFEITLEEYRLLRSQIGALKQGGHSKYLPMVFTEQGVAMLSGVLSSPRAINVNIAIMRTFTRLRQFLLANAELSRKLDELENNTQAQLNDHSMQIQQLFDALRQLLSTEKQERKQIGYRLHSDKAQDE